MKAGEFKKYIPAKVRIVKFLSYEQIEREYGWSYENRDKILCDIYSEKNEQKNKLFDWKQMTEFMDYKCDFDEKGKCRGTRNSQWNKVQCCCYHCNKEVGYLRIIPEARLEYFASIFNLKTGFWKKDVGCQIEDRRERSITCLRYSCHPDERFRNSMYILDNTFRQIESKILDLDAQQARHLAGPSLGYCES